MRNVNIRAALYNHFENAINSVEQLPARLTNVHGSDRGRTVAETYRFISTVQKFAKGTAFFVGKPPLKSVRGNVIDL